ncbi:MAG: Hsp20/alpha crystallin family protein [Parcubacteria group bacterium]|nr:Hsp20/alpha crystallin family protein [Parcubacteria group bacterium]
MSLIKWFPNFPFDEMDFLQGFMPAADVYETEKEVMVELSVPHIDPEKVDISIENNVLHIKGSTEKKTEVDDKDYYRREIRSGSFYRTIPLPAAVVGDQASAVHENGVLKITIPKVAEGKSKKAIKVKVIKPKGK